MLTLLASIILFDFRFLPFFSPSVNVLVCPLFLLVVTLGVPVCLHVQLASIVTVFLDERPSDHLRLLTPGPCLEYPPV